MSSEVRVIVLFGTVAVRVRERVRAGRVVRLGRADERQLSAACEWWWRSARRCVAFCGSPVPVTMSDRRRHLSAPVATAAAPLAVCPWMDGLRLRN